MSDKHCPCCQKKFVCETEYGCWCATYPKIISPEDGDSCYCPSCLAKKIQTRIDNMLKNKGLDELVNIAKQYRQQENLIENIDYITEDNLLVFSKWYHLKRGSCCDNGCRNCPYS